MRTLALFVGLLCVGCGGDTHESCAGEALDIVDEMIKVAGEVDSDDAAKKAVEKLEELNAELKEVLERYKKLEKPTQEQEEELKKTFQPRMDAIEKNGKALTRTLMAYPTVAKPFMDMGKEIQKMDLD